MKKILLWLIPIIIGIFFMLAINSSTVVGNSRGDAYTGGYGKGFELSTGWKNSA